jgi:hypothetical protein
MREKNLFIKQGETFLETVNVTNFDGTPFDLTGYTAIAQMRPDYSALYFQDLHPIIAADPTTGVLTLNLVYLETAALKDGRWVYSVVVQNASGNTIVCVSGIITVDASAVFLLPTTTTTTTTTTTAAP